MTDDEGIDDKKPDNNCDRDAERAGRRERGGSRETQNDSKEACLGITPLLSSHLDDIAIVKQKAVVAIDWLETAGVIQWDLVGESELREELCRLYTTAVEANEEQAIILNGMQCLIHPNGLGKGRQSRMTYRLTCGKTTLAFSLRENATRQNSNLVLTIPGESCLLNGALAIRIWAHQVIEDLGGIIADEWARRIDVCIDLPGIDPCNVLFPACESRQYISTVKKAATYCEHSRVTGFTIGSRNRLQIQIYDKLFEACGNHDVAYCEAMVQKRWKGFPTSATRVELRIGRGWISQWNQDQASNIIDNLGSVVKRVLLNESRTFFKLLADSPDRKNKHQSRCEVLPLWAEICKVMAQEAGSDSLELTIIERGQITLSRAYKLIRSMLSKAAAIRGETISSLSDALQQLKSLDQLNEGTDQQWRDIWYKKNVELGLPVKQEEFPFGGHSNAISDLEW